MLGQASFFLILVYSFALVAGQNEVESIYEKIDIINPSREDWALLQDYLTNGPREYLKYCERGLSSRGEDTPLEERASLAHRMRGMSIFNGIDPIEHISVPIDCSKSNIEKCVISYCTNNSVYREKLLAIPINLKKSGYRGHFLGQVGGWPCMQEGDLKLAHVPYAFKISMFREAQKRGYRYVLWMDSAMRPADNLDRVFQKIKKDGYYLTSFLYPMHYYCSDFVRKQFGLSHKQLKKIPYVAAGVIGFDLKHPKGKTCLDELYQAALGLDKFLSPRPEQVALSIIASKLHMKPQERLDNADKHFQRLEHKW